MSAGYSEGPAFPHDDPRNVVDHQLAPNEPSNTAFDASRFIDGATGLPLSQTDPARLRMFQASHYRAVQQNRQDQIFTNGPSQLPPNYVAPLFSGLVGTSRPELGHRPTAATAPPPPEPATASSSSSKPKAKKAKTDSAADAPPPPPVLCNHCNEPVTNTAPGSQCFYAPHAVHNKKACSDRHQNGRACHDCIANKIEAPAHRSKNNRMFKVTGKNHFVPYQVPAPSTSTSTASVAKPKKKSGPRKDKPKASVALVDGSIVLLPATDPIPRPLPQPVLQSYLLREDMNFPLVLEFDRKTPLQDILDMAVRVAARLLQDELLEYVRAKVVFIDAGGITRPDIEAQSHFNLLILFGRGYHFTRKPIIAIVDMYDTCLRDVSDHAILENRNVFFSNMRKAARWMCEPDQRTHTAHVRYWCYYLELIPIWIENQKAAGYGVAHFESTYHITIYSSLISRFLEMLLVTDSKKGDFDGDTGKKSGVLKNAHSSIAWVSRAFRCVNMHVPLEQYGCGGRSSDQCITHHDALESGRLHKASRIREKQAHNPHGTIQGQLEKFLDFDTQMKMRRFLFRQDRTTLQSSGWFVIKIMNYEWATGNRVSEARHLTWAENKLMKLEINKSEKVDEHLSSLVQGPKAPEVNGEFLYGAAFMITGAKTANARAASGKGDAHYAYLAETQHPLMCFSFIVMLELVMEYHGFLKTPEQKKAFLPFHQGIAGLRARYVFYGANWESPASYSCFYYQLVKVLKKFDLKIDEKAVHMFRMLWGERLRAAGVPEDAIESLWNFDDSSKKKASVKDDFYIYTPAPATVVASGNHNHRAKSIPIHRKCDIPSSLSSLVFDGAVVQFRINLSDPEKAKPLCLRFNSNTNQMDEGLESLVSLKYICSWFEWAVDGLFYNMAFLRVFETELVPWEDNKETGVKKSPIWMLLPTAFESVEFRTICVKVERQEKEAFAQRNGNLNGTFRSDMNPALFDDFLSRLLPEVSEKIQNSADALLERLDSAFTAKLNVISNLVTGIARSTGTPLIEADSNGATVSVPVVPVDPTPVASVAVDPVPVTTVSELPQSIESLSLSTSATTGPMSNPEFVDAQQWGLLSVKYRRPYDSTSLPESLDNIPICDLANFGHPTPKAMINEVVDTAITHFPVMHRRHFMNWRKAPHNPLENKYARYGNVVAHVVHAIEKLKEEGKSYTLQDGIDSVYDDKRFWSSTKKDGEIVYLAFSLTMLAKAAPGLKKDDFGLKAVEAEVKARSAEALKKKKENEKVRRMLND